MDYNATTPLDPVVLEEVVNTLKNFQGNPSSVYEEGRAARILIEDSRDFVKSFLDAGGGGEIVFTSSGSESINLAIIGAVYAYKRLNKNKPPHIITSQVEHHAVLNTFKFLETQGVETSYIGINEFGELSMDDLLQSIKENTILVSVMGANNETGTIFPLRQILKAVKNVKDSILFHSDLVQIIGKSGFSLKDIPLDLCSFSGHKFYALKGCGALYIKKGVKIDPIIYGGHQERGLRAGTENTAGIVSIAKGLGVFRNNMDDELKRISNFGGVFLDKLFSAIEGIKLNGHPVNRLKNTVNVSFDGVKAESLLFNLDLYGISASAGSACNAGAISLSHVLKAHGYDIKRIESAIRFSIGRFTTMDDIDYAISAIKKGVLKLRTNPA
ncbi:MAG: cysteine desulfurase family protein [Deltaproteobacteria bacterium]|nr:cysteine desulfurase [Deltaproteobacteria bacterium]MCL5880724.1 cysteine desulfurase [Deltaproteobacteria bacterium]MDA8304201.1 cysteine desulfurase family protein [Deltaproteobacteria bacterium]